MLLVAMLTALARLDDSTSRADLVYVNRGDVFTLDPQRMSYLKDFRMAYALYEGLVRWDNTDFTIQPAASELPDISADRLTYTFHIKPEAKWSNGDPVTSHDFLYAWKRLLFPDTAADYSNLFFIIDGASEFWAWRNEQLAEFAQEPSAGRATQLWNLAQAHFERSVGIRALDDHTLEIRLRQPTAYFLDLVCFAPSSPVHRPSVEGWPESIASDPRYQERGWIGVELPSLDRCRWAGLNPESGRFEQKHQWARPGRLVSNGPYILAEWRFQRDMRLVKNPYFHTPEIVKSDSILALTIADTNTSTLAFATGRLDWLTDVNAEYQADMLQQKLAYEQRYANELAEMSIKGRSMDDMLGALPPPEEGERRDIHIFPAFGTDFFSFNCRPFLTDGRSNPFSLPAVRRAFALCVNKQTIVEQVTRLNEPVVTTLIPPDSIPGYNNPAGLGYDPNRGRQELESIGWKDRNSDGLIENENGELFPIIDLLWTTNTSRYKWISLELKAQWEQALGVRVELRGVDTRFYKEDLKQGNFMIARGRWYGDYGDPTTFLNLCRSTDGNNDRGYENEYVDAMLDAAALELDPARRMKILEDCERFLFTEEMPLIPICQLVQVYMYEPGRVKGLTQHPRLVQYLWQIEVRKEKEEE